MKKLLLIITIAIFASHTAYAQEVLAKVNTIDGKEIYILNEPVKRYEVVEEVRTGLKIASVLTRGLYNEDILDKVAQFSRRAERKLSKEDKEFDALLYQNGRRAQAIRFMEKKSDQKDGVARVIEFKGVYTFILASPMQEYHVQESIRGTIKLLPLFTNGFLNYSIANDIGSYVRKANRKSEDVYAVKYDTGRIISVIAFID